MNKQTKEQKRKDFRDKLLLRMGGLDRRKLARWRVQMKVGRTCMGHMKKYVITVTKINNIIWNCLFGYFLHPLCPLFCKCVVVAVFFLWLLQSTECPQKRLTREKTFFFFVFYIQSIWLIMLRWNRGCVCVCMYVCMYVCVWVCVCVTALQPKRMDGFWWNFLHMIWQIFARYIFLWF